MATNIYPHIADLFTCGISVLLAGYVLVSRRYNTGATFTSIKLSLWIMGWAVFLSLAVSAVIKGRITGFPFSNPAPGIWLYAIARGIMMLAFMMDIYSICKRTRVATGPAAKTATG